MRTRCLVHVINLGIVAVMSHVTKIATMETVSAILEYDLEADDNQILGRSVDVIAAIWTIAIKIQCSSQQIKYFNKLQIQCKFNNPLKIPLPSNVQWGTNTTCLITPICFN
ncbi:hypothetical protein AX14_002750, partial [Amanita brunnescens Koide BX004]